jgi:ATP-dependent DNA helicase RecG
LRCTPEVRRLVVVACGAGYAVDGFLLEAMADDRLARRRPELQACVTDEVAYLETLSARLFSRLGEIGCAAEGHELQHATLLAAHAAASFLWNRVFSTLDEYPWRLCQGDVAENLERLRNTPLESIGDTATRKLQQLLVLGYNSALLQDAVEFDRLGLVVVDEQHRFGVEQRDRLRAKAPEGLTPHLLVMTATPIPRTVALTVFGDLETSTLRELPRGRQPIATNTIFVNEKPQWLERAWQRVAEEVAAGRQAYVVASRIDDSDKPTGEDQGGGGQGVVPIPVITLFEQLHRGPLSGLRLGLMHGRLSAEEKDAVMAGFRVGEIDVLVCTTVIEVGVDVPNATVMVVIDADRFGISQLHQLRGRIGRGAHPSLCLLATRLPEDSKAGGRLNAVAGTLDGFVLADLDLAERREGDVLGSNQSGRAVTLRFLSLAQHLEVILAARELCDALYVTDPVNAGMAVMARQFTGGDRMEYLDKS